MKSARRGLGLIAVVAMLAGALGVGGSSPAAAAPPPMLYVQPVNTVGGGSCGSPDYNTVGAAVAAAAAGAVIRVCAGVYPISSPILVDKALTLRGDGGLSSILDGGGTSQIIQAAASTPITVDIEDLTFRHAEGTNGSAVVATLDNVALNIRRSTFYANVGSAVYALWSGGCCWETESMTVDSSTFVGNTAVGGGAGDGGAVFLYGSTGAQSHAITNNTFVGNTATRSGGAVALVGVNQITVASNTFLDNAQSGASETLFARTSNMAVTGNVFASSTPSSAPMCDIDVILDSVNTFADDVATSECATAAIAPFADLDLGPLGSWGGPTQTVRVGAASSIGALQTTDCPATDQRGVTRGSGACTPGSFEYLANAAALSPLAQTISGTAATAIAASTAFTATDFAGAVTYSIAPALPSAAALPAGLVMDPSTGVLSGTPSAASTGTFLVTATGATSGTASALITLSIGKAAQAISVTTSAPASASVGSTFPVAANATSGLSVAIAATGGCSGSGSGSAAISVTTLGTDCTVTFSQGGNGAFDAASTITQITTPTSALLTTEGYFQPVDTGRTLNTVKGGSVIPVKFRVVEGSQLMTDPSRILFAAVEISCASASTTSTDPIEQVSSVSSTVRWDPIGLQFVQNWRIPSTRGRCYRITHTIAGTTLTATFMTK